MSDSIENKLRNLSEVAVNPEINNQRFACCFETDGFGGGAHCTKTTREICWNMIGGVIYGENCPRDITDCIRLLHDSGTKKKTATEMAAAVIKELKANKTKGYIGKLNIVAAEYLAKAGMARVACVTCQVPALSGASSGVIFSRPLSVRVLPSGSACIPFPGGSVHSSNNPYIGATGRFISIINVPTTSSPVCEYTTCRTNVGVDGNIQRSQSYAMGPYPWIGNHPSCEAIPNHQLIPLLRRS